MTKKPQADAGKPEDQRDETDAETIRDLTTPDEEAEGVTGGATAYVPPDPDDGLD